MGRLILDNTSLEGVGRNEFACEEQIIYGKRSLKKTKGKALYLSSNGAEITIEQLALEHYHANGFKGYWTENVYWWQIMTLLYWDVVYARLSGVLNFPSMPFPSETQDIPHDMFTQEFYPRRQKIINKRHKSLSESSLFGLRSPSPEKELRKAWHQHKGKFCRFFGQWDLFSIDQLVLVTQVLSNLQLITVMDRVLRDFNNNRKGFPDLFLAKDNKPLFVEVKSKRERIAPHQSDWHHFLVEKAGIQVIICRVTEQR